MKSIFLQGPIVCLLLALLPTLGGCGLGDRHEQDYQQLAPALTKVTSAAEATIRYENHPANLDGQTLLALATAHDASLLEPFSQYQLHLFRIEDHALLLLCSADGERALMEDSGCTAKLDKQQWQQGTSPCETSIAPANICLGEL
ncbi:hypothetical protein [Shewanella chilikensis]|uniref:hypothetical protein n=1 Tax=Shewanella chilikensis TaxID=558541 RepID=UPI00399C0075